MAASNSLTRFGEILQLWQNLQNLGQFWGDLFTNWKKNYLLWQILYAIGHISVHANGQMLKNNQTIWSHLASKVKF